MKKLMLIAVARFCLRDGELPSKGPPNYPDTSRTVTLYATEWCGYCAKTRGLFPEHDVVYVEMEVEADLEADVEKSERDRREHARLGGSGVPVVTIDETVILGYGPDRILAALDAP